MPSQREPRHNLLFYYAFKWLVVSPVYHFAYQGRVEGQAFVPSQGPVIVVSNHASNFDPPFLSHVVGRPVAYMAKAELFRVPVLAPAIRLYGAYPVVRGGMVRQSLKTAEQMLAANWAVGIFLNGTRTVDGRIPEPQLGASLLSARRQVPLLPVALWGTENIQPKGQRFPRLGCPLTARIGELIAPPKTTKRPDLTATTEHCTAVIHRLLDQGR